MSTTLTIQGAFSGLNKAFELVKAINNLDRSVEVNKVTMELQQIILAAQQEINSMNADKSAMLEEVDSLKKEIIRMETWETEKQKYELKRVGYSAFAHVIKDSMKGAEPEHWICTTCYENGKKSILQGVIEKGIGLFTKCFTCKTQIDAQVPHIPIFDGDPN